MYAHRTGTFAAYYGIHSIKTNLFVASLCCDSNQFSTAVIFSFFISTTVAIQSWICVVPAHANTHTCRHIKRTNKMCYPNTLAMGNNVTTMRKCSFKRNKHADNRKHKEKRWKKPPLVKSAFMVSVCNCKWTHFSAIFFCLLFALSICHSTIRIINNDSALEYEYDENTANNEKVEAFESEIRLIFMWNICFFRFKKTRSSESNDLLKRLLCISPKESA